MKTIFKIAVVLPLASIFLAGSFIMSVAKAEAQAVPGISPIPFGTAPTGPQITQLEVCCNGLKLTITPGVSVDEDAATAAQNAKLVGTYIFPWQNMIPDPEAGMGLYQWWSLEEDSSTLGNKTPAGTCQTATSECETAEATTYTILEVGTNLLTGVGAAV